MNFEELKKEVKNKFFNFHNSHDFDHTERVLNLAIKIGEKENADLEIIELAALLHDIGRKDEDESKGKICHAEQGKILARKFLEEKGFETEKIERVSHCIECHRFRRDKIPETKEARILFDADKIDSIGAIGIGRAFVFAGEVGAKVHNKKGIDVEKTKEYSEDDTAYREFLVKLSKIKDRMFTDEGKKIAQERHDFMTIFFDRLNKEVEGDI